MPDIAATLTAFREHLIAADLVRRPSEATPDAPPCHIEPQDGAPAPGEREGVEDDQALTVSLFGTELGETNFDAGLRRRVLIELRYRPADNAALRTAEGLDTAIRGELIQPATSYGYGFELGTAAVLLCHQATLFAGLSTLSRGRDVAYDLTAKWLIEVPA